MPIITLPLDPATKSPIFAVTVAFPASVHTGAGNAAVTSINMLIDTGASQTSVSTAVAAQLSLPILGKIPLKSVSHSVSANLYLADLLLPIRTPPVPVKDIKLVEFAMGNAAVGGLLGMDILRHGLFAINGVEETFTLAF